MCDGLAAAGFEDVDGFVAVGAGESAHVFYDAENGYLHFFDEVDGFSNADEGNILGGGDDDGAVTVWDELCDAEWFVTGSWW